MGEKEQEKRREKKHKEQGGVGATRLWYLSNKRHLMKDRESSELPTAINPLKNKIPGPGTIKQEEGFWGMKLGS